MSVVSDDEPRIAPLSSQVQSIQYRASQNSRATLNIQTMLRSAWGRLSLWHQKRASRRALRDLTDDELLDIGVTRAEARKEAGKSFFWD
ncbi:DUF1127 domain-containing protein [Rhizobium cauense]|nr:DUF1127 domain-containing protein [Rhizobium cauense]MBW9115030.1 DUF1127 domain-containing protein [Rhizobium cauense]